MNPLAWYLIIFLSLFDRVDLSKPKVSPVLITLVYSRTGWGRRVRKECPIEIAIPFHFMTSANPAFSANTDGVNNQGPSWFSENSHPTGALCNITTPDPTRFAGWYVTLLSLTPALIIPSFGKVMSFLNAFFIRNLRVCTETLTPSAISQLLIFNKNDRLRAS